MSCLLIGTTGCADESLPEATSATIPSDVGEQIRKLQSPAPMDRIIGARNLARMKSKAAPAIPFLIELLADNRVAEGFFDRLWNKVTLGGAGTGVDLEAGGALLAIGYPAVDPLIAVLKAQNPRVRYRAASLLGDLAFRGIKAQQAVVPLIDSLHDPEEEVRMWAARSLGNYGDRTAVEPLIACLEDTSPLVRGDAATSLGNLGDFRAIQHLIDMLRRGGPNSDFAQMALRTLTGEDFGTDSKRWQDWWNQQSEKGL